VWNYFVTDLPFVRCGACWKRSPGLLDADEKQTAARPPRCFPSENPDPPLRAISHLVGDECNPWMAGMQFYLSDPMDLGVPGHLNFVDSKWALTAIVQSQFWGPDFVDRYGHSVVRAILSVDIAEFDVPGELEFPGEPAPLTLRQLAMKSQTFAAAEQRTRTPSSERSATILRRRSGIKWPRAFRSGTSACPRPETTAVMANGKKVEFPDSASLSRPPHRLDAMRVQRRLQTA
jgi:hypothetical protein